jgi:hypothetical protein
MPSLPDVLARLSFLAATPAIVGLIVTASLIVISSDWRLSLGALSVQYVLVGLLLTRLIQPQVAVIKVLVGALVCVVLYLTARLVSETDAAASLQPGDTEEGHSPPFTAPISMSQPLASNLQPQATPSSARTLWPELAFRLLATLFVGLAIYSLSRRYPLPEVALDISFACYWLASLGLLNLVLTEEPLRAGMGLLTFITGFELLFSVLERSLSVVGFLGIANFLIALAIAYIAPSTALRQAVRQTVLQAQEAALQNSSGQHPSSVGQSASGQIAAPEAESAAGRGEG